MITDKRVLLHIFTDIIIKIDCRNECFIINIFNLIFETLLLIVINEDFKIGMLYSY